MAHNVKEMDVLESDLLKFLQVANLTSFLCSSLRKCYFNRLACWFSKVRSKIQILKKPDLSIAYRGATTAEEAYAFLLLFLPASHSPNTLSILKVRFQNYVRAVYLKAVDGRLASCKLRRISTKIHTSKGGRGKLPQKGENGNQHFSESVVPLDRCQNSYFRRLRRAHNNLCSAKDV